MYCTAWHHMSILTPYSHTYTQTASADVCRMSESLVCSTVWYHISISHTLLTLAQTHIHPYIQTHTHTHTYIHTYIHTHTQTHKHTHTHTHTHTHAVCVCVCVCLFTHPTHTHTHKVRAQVYVGCQRVLCVLLCGIIYLFSHPTHTGEEGFEARALAKDYIKLLHFYCQMSEPKALTLEFKVEILKNWLALQITA